jgi:hypothetical protein
VVTVQSRCGMDDARVGRDLVRIHAIGVTVRIVMSV